MFDIEELSQRLSASARAIVALVDPIAERDAHWKPSPERWSALEIICHLVDEEQDDFRRRVESTLFSSAAEWPPIDPEGWVTSREYAKQSWTKSIAEFRQRRDRSIEWLRSLDRSAIDWLAAYSHPKIGRIRAGDLAASWVAHDLLHLRQLTRWIFEFESMRRVDRDDTPFVTLYAGEW